MDNVLFGLRATGPWRKTFEALEQTNNNSIYMNCQAH
jgi:hypothetical protein